MIDRHEEKKLKKNKWLRKKSSTAILKFELCDYKSIREVFIS